MNFELVACGVAKQGIAVAGCILSNILFIAMVRVEWTIQGLFWGLLL